MPFTAFSCRGSGAASSWCRAEAVASHHFGERCGVGRAASCCLEDGVLLEIVSGGVTEKVRAIGGVAAATPRVLDSRRVDVSSTEIRERAHQGRSIRGFVTDAVAQYIEFNGLYR